jgi:hypothetical protein
LAKVGSGLVADDDAHGRDAALSDLAFYPVVDAYREASGNPGVFLGLRAEESYGRLRNRTKRGPVYQKRNGEWVCQPLCDWSGLDVFAYLFSVGAPVLDVYRCCRMHESPAHIRKAWWYPGAHSQYGGMIWLKSYWPSLFRKLRCLVPDAARLA